MTEPKTKKITRALPCSSYDVERIESWLGSMAKNGLLLEGRSPFFYTLLYFLPCTPQTVRYRLEPKAKGVDYADEPPLEAREIAQEAGWEFICALEAFYVYRSCRPDAPEMNTDTTVQAASLKRLKRSTLFSLFWQIVFSGHLLWGFGKEPYRVLVTFGSLYAFTLAAFFLWCLIHDFLRVRYIFQLQKQLRNNIPMEHDKPWEPHAKLYRFGKIAVLALTLFAITLFLTTCTKTIALGQPSVEEYPGKPPFPLLRDLYPGSTITNAGMNGMYNYYQRTDSDCAPIILDWRQYVTLRGENGESYGSRTLIIQYYETSAPWMARGLAQDFLRRDAQWRDPNTLEALTKPDLGLDYAMVYHEIFPTIVLQHGNIMVHATISDEADLYRWAEWMAAQMKATATG